MPILQHMLAAGFSGSQRDNVEHTAMRSIGAPQVQTSVPVLQLCLMHLCPNSICIGVCSDKDA